LTGVTGAVGFFAALETVGIFGAPTVATGLVFPAGFAGFRIDSLSCRSGVGAGLRFGAGLPALGFPLSSTAVGLRALGVFGTSGEVGVF